MILDILLGLFLAYLILKGCQKIRDWIKKQWERKGVKENNDL